LIHNNKILIYNNTKIYIVYSILFVFLTQFSDFKMSTTELKGYPVKQRKNWDEEESSDEEFSDEETFDEESFHSNESLLSDQSESISESSNISIYRTGNFQKKLKTIEYVRLEQKQSNLTQYSSKKREIVWKKPDISVL
jgi:hypothetical protein